MKWPTKSENLWLSIHTCRQAHNEGKSKHYCEHPHDFSLQEKSESLWQLAKGIL
jgi:hypothetical protein